VLLQDLGRRGVDTASHHSLRDKLDQSLSRFVNALNTVSYLLIPPTLRPHPSLHHHLRSIPVCSASDFVFSNLSRVCASPTFWQPRKKEPRVFAPPEAVSYMQKQLWSSKECQTTLINDRKGGRRQPISSSSSLFVVAYLICPKKLMNSHLSYRLSGGLDGAANPDTR